MESNIFPVIVIYKTPLEECRSFLTLLRANKIENFLVFDNSPIEYNQQLKMSEGVVYVRNTNNAGLPAAYNLAAKIAAEKGYKRILLLDQDTAFSSDAWSEYEKFISYQGIVAPLMRLKDGSIFSPVPIIGKFFHKKLPRKMPYECSLRDYTLVNSGCCIPVDLFLKIGGYDEKVKLDFADWQFQLRFRKMYDNALIINTEAEQDFSNDCSDFNKVFSRYILYLDSGKHFKPDSYWGLCVHHYLVLRHTMALSIRFRNMMFLKKYFQDFLIK